jgi:IPT/TIG domain
MTDPRSAPQPGPAEPGRELVSLRRAGVTAGLLAAATVLVFYTLVVVWPPAPPAPVLGPPTRVTTTETTPGTDQTTPPTDDTAPTTDPTPTTEPGSPTTERVSPTTEPGSPTTSGTGRLQPPAYAPEPADEASASAEATDPTTLVVRQASNPPVRAYGAELQLNREVRLFWVVALSGLLGGLLHAMRSLLWYAGNRNLRASWLVMYGLLPFVGLSLAVIVYVVARGGLIVVSAQPSADIVNPFGFAALGALAGLFSREAAEWLRGVFERLLTTAEPGRDTSVQPTITGVDPPSGPPWTPVTISGTGFVDVAEVSFGGTAADDWQVVSDAEISATVPEGAVDGHVRVLTPGGTARSPEPFTVDEVVTEPPARPVPEPGAGQVRRRWWWRRQP